jgi:hypothetical protein
VQRVVAAINGMAGNQPATQAAANQFARQKIVNDLRAITLTWEKSQADTARDADPTDRLNGSGMTQA